MDDSEKGWRVYFGDEDHCVPLVDLIEHPLTKECSCVPLLCSTESGHVVWVHHAADAREYFEPDFDPQFTGTSQ